MAAGPPLDTSTMASTLESSHHGLTYGRREYNKRVRSDGPYADNLDVDVLIVGGGFTGTYMLYLMRKEGYNTVLYDAGTQFGGMKFGGAWHSNAYPGAGIDTEVPIYEVPIPELENTWKWKTNSPDYKELQEYYRHIDKLLNLSKDASFQTVVTGAEFDTKEAKWNVTTADGRHAKARFLIVSAGFSSRRRIPNFKNLHLFKGIVHHPSFWPLVGVETADKRVAVIGTGASGVQIVQEFGPIAKKLTLFHRSPNLEIPARKKELTVEQQQGMRLYDLRERSFGSFAVEWDERNLFDNTTEEREQLWESLWQNGGFSYWIANYNDYVSDLEANTEVYKFWKKKRSTRVRNTQKREALHTEESPYAFSDDCPFLEQNYYEVLDSDNVEIVDVAENSGNEIVEFTEKGLKTKDQEFEFDVIALATGFEAGTGGLTNMGLKSTRGTPLREEWINGTHTYLDTTINGYPNMFQVHGPQGPTSLCNGPTAVEVQGQWVRDIINKMGREKIKSIDATEEAQRAWESLTSGLSDRTIFPAVRSVYMGGNIPGKVEQLAGGIVSYKHWIRMALDEWKGFTLVRE